MKLTVTLKIDTMTTGDETLKITFLEPEKILDADTGLRQLTYDYYEVNLGVSL